MSFTGVDPVTGKETQSFQYASEDLLNKSLQNLHQTFLVWKKIKPAERQKILMQLALRMAEQKDRLADLITTEMGKAIKDSVAEVEKCIKTIEKSCELDLSFLEGHLLASPYTESRVYHEPLGVIYSVMPWNYPLWQAVRMFVPALLSGNTVLLKHSEITPLLAQAVHELFEGLYEKPLLINLYLNHESTDRIMGDARVGGVSLTGSVRAGHAIYASAAQYFKKAVLELGGSDPYLVLEDADLNLAAKKIAKSRLTNNGQTCIACKRAIVHRKVIDQFIENLKKEMDAYQIGDPKNPQTDLGTLAHPKFKAALKLQTQELKNETDAVCIYSKNHGQDDVHSAFVNPEVYLLSKNANWLKDQEFFGPVLILIPFDSEAEAVQIANSTIFALGAAVFSQDLVRSHKIAQELIAGQVAINDVIASDMSLPFGGFKSSGIGRELGREAYFEFTETKVISHL